MNGLKTEKIIELEPSFMKVPYEQLRKTFKNEYKYLEKELLNLQDIIERCLRSNAPIEKTQETVEILMRQIEKIIERMNLYRAEGELDSRRVEKRVDNLGEIDQVTSSRTPEFVAWSKTRLNRGIVDYLLREGLSNTAKEVAEEEGIVDLVDIDLFSQAEKIEQALQNQNCKECLVWCAENRSSLKKTKSTLEFNLRLQEHIELARASKGIEAIGYAQKHLTPWKTTEGLRIGQAMALLAYKSNTQCQPYKAFYDPRRWSELIEQFRADYYALCSLTPHPMMSITLQAGLSALKTQQCYEHDNKNVNCPVCDENTLGKLAEKLPLSHHVNSTLVCRLSGKIMNEDNPPMLLPNGRVYSQTVNKITF
ncbi:CTLH/CRA C-terminal to lish motif domain-containing protein [Sporodiniella umbellata]|nr:CTLH/CRA C-terminal to lish motif domain-containing protein [Sporodiniella umbellata]